jgi:hypothetical protein
VEKSKFSLPEWVPKELWDGFLEMRKAIKKPATDRAQRLLLNKLSTLQAAGFPPDRVLEQSIINSWQGLFEPHEGGKYGHFGPAEREAQANRILAKFARESLQSQADGSGAGLPKPTSDA